MSSVVRGAGSRLSISKFVTLVDVMSRVRIWWFTIGSTGQLVTGSIGTAIVWNR